MIMNVMIMNVMIMNVMILNVMIMNVMIMNTFDRLFTHLSADRRNMSAFTQDGSVPAL